MITILINVYTVLCAADKTGAKVVEDWICPSFDPTSPRPHDDDPTAGDARSNAQASAADSSFPDDVESDAAAAGDGVEGTPLVGAYVGGTLAVLVTLLAVTATLSYYVAARS